MLSCYLIPIPIRCLPRRAGLLLRSLQLAPLRLDHLQGGRQRGPWSVAAVAELPSWGLLGPVGDGDMDLKILLPVTFSAILYSRLNHFQCDKHLIKNYCSRIYPLRLFFVECTFLCTLQGYFHCEPLSISLSISQVKGLHPEDMAPTERAPACLVNACSKHHAIDTTARIGKLCDGTGKRQCHA